MLSRGAYYVDRYYLTLTSGRTFVNQNYFVTYTTGFDKENLQRYGALDTSYAYARQDNKISATNNQITDVAATVTQSTYSCTGIFKDIHPSTAGYTWDTGTTWSMDTYSNSYQRLCTVSTDDMYWWETGSTLTFDGMKCYGRVSDNLVTNGDFTTDTDWTLANAWIADGKLQKSGTSAAYGLQDIGIEVDKNYEVVIKYNSTRWDDTDRFYVGLGTTSIDVDLFGSTNTRRYVYTDSISNSNIYLYFQDNIGGSVDFVEVYEVEEQIIHTCYINNLQDNVFFPSSAATMTVMVSSDAGVNWDVYNYENSREHTFTNPGTEFQVKFIATGDRASGPAYIQSTKILNVDLFNETKDRILRVDGKVLRMDGNKIVRI